MRAKKYPFTFYYEGKKYTFSPSLIHNKTYELNPNDKSKFHIESNEDEKEWTIWCNTNSNIEFEFYFKISESGFWDINPVKIVVWEFDKNDTEKTDNAEIKKVLHWSDCKKKIDYSRPAAKKDTRLQSKEVEFLDKRKKFISAYDFIAEQAKKHNIIVNYYSDIKVEADRTWITVTLGNREVVGGRATFYSQVSFKMNRSVIRNKFMNEDALLTTNPSLTQWSFISDYKRRKLELMED